MILKTFEYAQFMGDPREWSISGLCLGDVNLLVGRNATGKSRSLNVIGALAKVLAGKFKPQHTARWRCGFEDGEKEATYHIEYDGPKIIREVYEIDGTRYVERSAGGKGFIYFDALQKSLDFEIPEDECVCAVRRDKIQHSFLESLSVWAHSLRLYHFGDRFGQNRVWILVKSGGEELDPANEEATAALFRKGWDKFGEEFKQHIIQDMSILEYPLHNIVASASSSLPAPLSLAGEPILLSVSESDLNAPTEQFEISAGMFRALSILIHLNYSLLTGTPSCILVDDIGEGLDFERSCALIELLRRKAADSYVQLLMSTNDRFVMNNVPIEAWSILKRDASSCQVYNYKNSRKKFEEFKLTGLNNFDFFAMDFISEDAAYEEHAEENGDIH